MVQTMTRSKVQDIPKPDLEQDRSSVAGCNDAYFEPTAAQSPGKMLRISSRQQTSLREREQESCRQRGAKPGQQRRPHSAEKTVYSNKYRDAKFKSVGSLPRAMQERNVKTKTRNRS